MRRKITAVLITVCMLVGMTPLFASAAGSISMPKELSDFLVAYEFGGQTEFDFRDPMQNAEKGGIMSSIVGHPTCVNYRTYPVSIPNTYWNGSDPMHWAERYGAYMTFDIYSTHWIAKNIFNISDEDISILVKRAYDTKQFYSYGGKYYLPMGGIGDLYREVEYSYKQQIGDYYYIKFSHYISAAANHVSNRDLLGTFYAVVKQKTINGKSYWTMYAHSEDPIDFNDVVAEADFFHDVKKNAYYRSAVEWAVEEGITNGTSPEVFDSLGGCSRAQAVTFLWRAAGSPAVSGSAGFKDVPAGQYYTQAVTWAVQKGITNGIDETHFGPDQTCTRGQIVTFLWRNAGSPNVSASVKFLDVPYSSYYLKPVAWAVQNNITKGMSADKFEPDRICTRAQIVTFLWRAMS
ncbi:MAG: S-layer homology domain-containing protein [Firmicutes bacterium]|nr:S-layer homology domain-containing protein [Bacillota bacterium]